VKLIFDSELIKENCTGCKDYTPHMHGKTDDGLVFKCMLCNRITAWLGGDEEKVLRY